MSKILKLFLIAMLAMLVVCFVINGLCNWLHLPLIIRFGLSIISGWYIGRWLGKKAFGC